jgi:2-polyprenyl-6-hydroxyphenyl methylase/3-demethylubiquinone-9 3-methyltransferase
VRTLGDRETDLRQYYGRAYARKLEGSQTARRLARLIPAMRLYRDDRLLDFGCGTGRLMPLVAPRVRAYVGVDFSEAMVQVAESRRRRSALANARVTCSSVRDFAASNVAAFDVAVALDVSEHIPDGDWLAALRSIRVSLVEGGRLYLHTPNSAFFVEMLKDRNMLLRQFPEHVAVRTVEANKALLEKAGFTIVRVSLLPHYNVLRYLHRLAVLPFLGKHFAARIFIEAMS